MNMMSKRVRRLGAVLFGGMLFLSGCERDVAEGLYSQLSDSAVLLSVGDLRYTKGHLEGDVGIMRELMSMMGSAEEVERADPNALRKSVLAGVFTREVLIREASRRGMGLAPEDLEAYQTRFMSRFFQGKKLALPEALSRLGNRATMFQNNLTREALASQMQALIQSEAAARAEIPQETVERERKVALARGKEAEAFNRTLGALATNAWRSIRAGNDFVTVGRKLQEMKPEIVYEPDCPANARLEEASKANGLTPPLPVADGLEIVRGASGGGGRCSRIRFLFRKADVSAMENAALEAQRKKAGEEGFRKRVDELKRSADVRQATQVVWDLVSE